MSFATSSLRIALLENIHGQASRLFQQAGIQQIDTRSGAMEGEALRELLTASSIIGLRSKTHLRSDLLRDTALDAIGCYCIGTDQVDLAAAAAHGIPVFNAPYSSTRSVAELVIGYALSLLRRIPEKSAAAHQGVWLKSVDGAAEMRNKTLGIVGYGHIGTQLSVLAENMGMRVIFHDIVDKLALGNAQKAAGLDALLAQADIVTLHVPATKQTDRMVDAAWLRKMKPGSILINAARGKVVDLEALRAALLDKHLSGAAIDVFPVEPVTAGDAFTSPLQGLPNVILTPHIGGSTLEAQEAIAADVTDKLLRYIRHGATAGAVNFPQVTVPPTAHLRFRHTHRNTPGMLARLNDVFSSREMNIAAQYLQTSDAIGYVVIDTDTPAADPDALLQALRAIPGTIRVAALLPGDGDVA